MRSDDTMYSSNKSKKKQKFGSAEKIKIEEFQNKILL